MKTYVGGLSPEVTDENLKDLFAPYGQIESAVVVKDRHTGQSRGFGFVEMPVRDEAISAIAALNGTELKGQTLNISEARPPAERRRGDGPGARDQHPGGRPGG